MSQTTPHLMRLLTLLACLSAPGSPRAATLFDAALGLPEAQGWVMNVQTIPAASIIPTLGPDGVHLSTTHLQSTGAEGGAYWWTLDSLDLDFTQDFAVEASVRIVSAPDHSIAIGLGWPRPGYAIALGDENGNFLWVGFGSGELFLSHSAYGAYHSSNTVHAAFNTTDGHHTYRIERGPGGVGAALRVDGMLLLHLPTLGTPDGSSNQPMIYFGDPTFWANSESHTAWIRAFTSTLDVAANDASRLLWARSVAANTGRSSVVFGAAAAGTLSLELFDAAGRRVEHTQRQVSAGESGRFEPAGTVDAGLYFYRLRLEATSGRAAQASGKLVLVN